MKMIEDWIWQDFDALESTNDQAFEWSKSAVSGQRCVITTKKQTAGRGRRGRSWIGLEGNLFMSLVFEAAACDLSKFVFISSLSLLNTIKQVNKNSAIDIKLKWPNDVLINGAKVSGILLEKGEGDFLISGIGVNIAHAPKDDTLLYPVVSLDELGIKVDCRMFLQEFLRQWNKLLDLWHNQGFQAVLDIWLKSAKSLGEEIVVKNENKIIKGIFIGVDENGALLLSQGGDVTKILAGDVFFNEE